MRGARCVNEHGGNRSPEDGSAIDGQQQGYGRYIFHMQGEGQTHGQGYDGAEPRQRADDGSVKSSDEHDEQRFGINGHLKGGENRINHCASSLRLGVGKAEIRKRATSRREAGGRSAFGR